MSSASLLSPGEGLTASERTNNHRHVTASGVPSLLRFGEPHGTQRAPLPSSDSRPASPGSWVSAGPCCSVPPFSSRFSLGNRKHKGAVSDDNQLLPVAEW